MAYTRRTLLAGLATLPALATTAAAASIPADPIFAAIARHRAALAALEVADQLAEPFRYAAAEQEIVASYDAMLATVPQTISGARALVDFLIEAAGVDEVQTLEVLRRGLDRLAARAGLAYQ
jgi:hypothetical protein